MVWYYCLVYFLLGSKLCSISCKHVVVLVSVGKCLSLGVSIYTILLVLQI